MDLAKKVEVFMNTEVIVLDARPRRILPRRTLVAITDAVLPVVAADKIAARPAINGRVEFFEQRQSVRAHAADVVGRHERRRADQKLSSALSNNCESCQVRRASRFEFDW